ncbi:unnamed protein product, partial [Discosporangium mesarthrocarpum]
MSYAAVVILALVCSIVKDGTIPRPSIRRRHFMIGDTGEREACNNIRFRKKDLRRLFLDVLPREEASPQQNILRAWDGLDQLGADGSGTIDHEELAPFLRELGVPGKRRMVDELMAHLDKDGSGDIGRHELTAWMATEGAALRGTVRGRLLWASQHMWTLGSSKRKAERQ